MKRWRIVTLAWLAVAFLLIGLCGPEPGAGVNLPHPVVFSVRSLNLLVEPSPAFAHCCVSPPHLYTRPDSCEAVRNSSLTTRYSCPNARVVLHRRIREGHGPRAGAVRPRPGCRRGRKPKATELHPTPTENAASQEAPRRRRGFATAFS